MLRWRRRFFEPGSLPVRERGLKSEQVRKLPRPAGSLPVRERGLKSVMPPLSSAVTWSLPVRERGLKLPFWIERQAYIFGRSPCGSVD